MQTTLTIIWTLEDDQKAFANGWGIFPFDGTGELVIMKIDDIQTYRSLYSHLQGVKNVRHFRYDNGAFRYVRKLAKNWDLTAKKALLFCPRQHDYLTGKLEEELGHTAARLQGSQSTLKLFL